MPTFPDAAKVVEAIREVEEAKIPDWKETMDEVAATTWPKLVVKVKGAAPET